MARNPALNKGKVMTASGIWVSPEDEKRIKEINEKFKDTSTAWAKIHDSMRMDVKFFNGVQYDEQWARAARARGSKVQIQLNMLPQYVQQVESQMRQMDLSINVHSTDEKGSEETSEIFEGIFRHIENVSNASNAYISAYGKNGALVPGIGYLKWNKKYVSPRSNEQELIIEEIKDPFKIIPDYFAKKSDFSDAAFWFEFDIMSDEEFKKKFPKAQLTSFQSWMDRRLKGWIFDTSVQVVKFWYKDTKPELLVETEDGRIGFKSEFEEEMIAMNVQDIMAHQAENPDEEVPTHRPLKMEVLRETHETKIKWVLTNGVEILEEGEWDDSEFPFVAFVGTDTFYDGERTIYGMIHNAHDPQKMINYMASKFVQKIGATNKSPWIAPIDAIPQNLRNDWDKSNVDEKAVLYYQEFVGGRQVTAPFRADNVEPAVQALLSGTQLFGETLKKTLGVPDAMLGITPDQAVQQSGVALHNLTEQGAQANHHFTDNMVLSMKRFAQLGIRLIPKIYDTARAIRIIGPDGAQELVKINEIFQRKGSVVKYDLTAGEYGVTVDTGPSYTTKKAQMVDQLTKLMQANPEIAPVILDKVMQNSDWDPDGTIADRVKLWQSIQMPWIVQNDQMPELPPQAKAQIQQMMAQHKQLIDAYQKAEQTIAQLTQEKQAKVIDNQAKIRLQMIKTNGELKMKEIDFREAMIQAQDEKMKFHIQEQLNHLRETRKFHLDMLKRHDEKYGTVDEDDYKALGSDLE